MELFEQKLFLLILHFPFLLHPPVLVPFLSWLLYCFGRGVWRGACMRMGVLHVRTHTRVCLCVLYSMRQLHDAIGLYDISPQATWKLVDVLEDASVFPGTCRWQSQQICSLELRANSSFTYYASNNTSKTP